MKKIILVLKQKWPEYVVEVAVITTGILLAFALNNWGENMRKEQLKKGYVNSLIMDLSRDTTQMGVYIRKTELDLEKSGQVLQGVFEANIDSLIYMVKYKFDITYNTNTIFNNNTFRTLIATGDINLLDKTIVDAVMDLSRNQKMHTDIIAANEKIHMGMISEYFNAYGGGSITGNDPIDNKLWAEVNEVHFLRKLSNLLEMRYFLISRDLALNIEMKNKTEVLLLQLLGSN